jgi:dihydropteroate synthase
MFNFTHKTPIKLSSEPQIMAILNLTPDSFFAQSRLDNIQSILDKTALFIKEGASIIDIGGQSTRPGATMISVEEEIDRIVPAIKAISTTYPTIAVSVDTFQSKVAEAALEAGASIINDISCGTFDPAILDIVAKYQSGYIGMHITGNKESMHIIPERINIITDLITFFIQKKEQLSKLGINNWVIDPGFGFGKSIQENFILIKELKQLEIIGLPILVGVSRKSSIYKTLDITADEALNGTTVVNSIALLNGAAILRVHDVKEAKQAIKLMSYLK